MMDRIYILNFFFLVLFQSAKALTFDVRIDQDFSLYNNNYEMTSKCKIRIVESIPEGLTYNGTTPRQMSSYEAWLELLDKLESSLEIASSYWSLRGSDVYPHPSAWQGEDIFKRLTDVACKGDVDIKIAQNLPDSKQPNLDTEELSAFGSVQVKSLNFSALMGAGILHTKLWIVDRTHFYVGSANFDWRSLTQVKEMGILVTDCPSLAEDMGKIFDVYWALGGENVKVPKVWPASLSTDINSDNPLSVTTDDDSELSMYLSSSPGPFCPEGRTNDIDAILRHIDEAEKFIYVAVMDYFPATLYGKPTKFWPVIDNALRKAAIERKVEVKLLASDWNHTRPALRNYLKSLSSLDGIDRNVSIQGKMFKVPSFSPDQAEIPFARVNHNKYMVTEKVAYIGTSNWSADYFLSTGGIGVIFAPKNTSLDQSQDNLRLKMEEIFKRDWDSDYSHEP